MAHVGGHRGKRAFCKALACVFLAVSLLALSACGSGGLEGETSGPAFEPKKTALSPYDEASLSGSKDAGVDMSSVDKGYVCAVGSGSSRLKLLVEKDGASYNYDLPTNGTPLVAPLTMGEGYYTFRIMRNTTGNRYVELYRTGTQVQFSSEFAPFLRPNVFCNYTASSACVAKAKELAQEASSEADFLKRVCEFVSSSVSYDTDKAARIAGGTGYVPDPDVTLEEGKGVCFDFASLTAALLRSQGIPTKIVTGTVRPDGFYHAWNMVYVNGTWSTVKIDIKKNTWSRVDMTLVTAEREGNLEGDLDYVDDRTY